MANDLKAEDDFSGFTTVSRNKKSGKSIQQRLQSLSELISEADQNWDVIKQAGKNLGAYYISEGECGTSESGFQDSKYEGSYVVKQKDKVFHGVCVEAKAIDRFSAENRLWIYTRKSPCSDCQAKIKSFLEKYPEVSFAVICRAGNGEGKTRIYAATKSGLQDMVNFK